MNLYPLYRVITPYATTINAANFIIVFLNEPCCKNLVTVAKKNIAGMVAKPNIAITKAPQSILAVFAANIVNKYTSPQGMMPFSIPKR